MCPVVSSLSSDTMKTLTMTLLYPVVRCHDRNGVPSIETLLCTYMYSEVSDIGFRCL